MLGVVDRLGPQHQYIVLSGNPDETYRQYNLNAVPRKNVPEVEKAISQADAVLFPGGSIFQDVTSFRSSIYYHGIVKLTKKHGKKLLFLNQGVGPLNSFIGKNQSRAAFNKADLIVVRDPQSATTLRNLGVTKKVHLGADSALLLPEPTKEDDETGYAVGSMKSVAISPRPFDQKGLDVVALFGETCRLLYQAGFAPTLLEMDSHEDGPLLELISKQQGGRIPQLRKLGNPRVVQSRLRRMDGVIAMRLHAGILATSVGVPPLMVSYDPKVTAFAKQLDIGSALSVENLTPQRLVDTFLEHHKSNEKKRLVLEKNRSEMVKEALKSIDLANEILN